MSLVGAKLLTRRQVSKAALGMAAVAGLSKWLRAAQNATNQGSANVVGPDSLRAHAAAHGLLYGAAVVPELLDVDGFASGTTSDAYTRLVAEQANILVAENAMKWHRLRPTATTFDFTQADKLMRFAGLAGQRVRGHNLCWQESIPAWVKTTATKDNAKQLLVNHIQTVAGRYRGRIHSWDVVNEAVNPKDGRGDGLRKSPWMEWLGPEYLEIAYTTAAQADPDAKLTYNEYGIELDTPEDSAKRAFVLMLLRRFKARGIPIHAVGIQSHLQANGPQPGAGLVAFIREARAMGLEAYVTEMDVNTHKLPGGPELQDAAVAEVYKNYLGLVLAEPNVLAALTWGITSAHSWINQNRESWSVRPDGARQRPLPFDDNLQPTPAFFALRSAIDAAKPLAAQPIAPPTAPAAKPQDLYKPFTVPGSPTTKPQGAS
jgi:endo-1,4-beta-xylanase